jgi:hypothetical protein
MERQPSWDEHARFMDTLVDEEFVILGGPLGEGLRVLLIVRAESEEAVHERLAADPWTPMELLGASQIERLEIRLGER